MNPGVSLTSGQSITSPNGAFRLVMQSDGNFVEYQGSSPVWATATSGAGNYAAMHGDDNLVVYNASNSPLWASDTLGNDGALVLPANSGVLGIDSSGGQALWQHWFGQLRVSRSSDGGIGLRPVLSCHAKCLRVTPSRSARDFTPQFAIQIQQSNYLCRNGFNSPLERRHNDASVRVGMSIDSSPEDSTGR